MSQAIGPAFQSFSAMFDAVGQMNTYKGMAAADKDSARMAELEAAYKSEDIHRRGRAVQGEAIAALAEGGGGVEGGSARDLIYQNSLEIEYAAMGARYQGALEARGYRYKAAQEKRAAKMALYGGILRAGAAAVTGYSAVKTQQAQDAALRRQQQAYFPGAMTLPVPPTYSPQYRPGP